jgi:hypothetical protein
MEVAVGSLAGAQIFIVDDDPAMACLLEAAVVAAGGLVAGSAADFTRALERIEALPGVAVLLALFVRGVRCDAIAAELTRRSIPFAVTAGCHFKSAPPTPDDARHFQINFLIELLANALRAQAV